MNDLYDVVRCRCADYIVMDDEPAQLTIGGDEAAVRKAQQWFLDEEGAEVSMGEAEFACIAHPMYPQLTRFGALWLHASVLEMEGAAYAFTAPSGYGKSTHAQLWLEAFGDRTRIINGDNPILREMDGVFHAFGTPFCGKEGKQVNTGVPLRGICFLRHAQENRIDRIDPAAALTLLFRSNTRVTPDTLEAHLRLYERLVEKVPVYVLHCNMDVGAAYVAWEGMRPR
ncbi:MAG: hypothetical protein IJZ74_06170 [Clostridia bacterium]|nr:hypothetical protein [Clostridia bacterium]